MKIARTFMVFLLGTASSLSAALTKTTTTLSSSLNPSTYGQTVTFTAVVVPAPPNGEVVTFKQGNNVLATEQLSGGSATFATSALTTGGTDNIKAVYSGDSTFAVSTSNTVMQVVDAAATTTTLTSSLNPSNTGQSVTFTASVATGSGGTVAGNVKFYNGSTQLAAETLSGGIASYSTTDLPAGTDSITAVYKGSSSFASSTSNALSQTVGTVITTTTSTLTSSLNPSTYGQTVTFTAVVAPTPPNGDIVTFKQGNTVLGTKALSGGSAAFPTSTLTTGGTDNIKAVFSGDPNFAGSTSNTVSQVVNQVPTTTTLASSPDPSYVGQSVTLTATVRPEFGSAPTGNVAFYNGSTRVGLASLSGGVATVATTNLPLGADSITAVYGGSSSLLTSTSSAVSQTVSAGTYIDSSLTWDNVTRYYQVFLPPNLPANPPLLLMLHGTQTTVSTGSDPTPVITLNWGWNTLASQYGFILVQPASTYNANSHQWNWNSYFMDASFTPAESGTCTTPPATGCPDDAGFLRQLIVNLTAQYNVNPEMVYVAGFSSGAQMSERVGVEISDLVAAIVPASGQMEGQQATPPPVQAPGPAVAPISVQAWQGTLDTELPPCNYGKTGYSGVIYYLDTVDDTFNYWTGPNANTCTVFQTNQPLCLDSAPNNANDAPAPGLTGFTGNTATGCSASNTEVQFIWEPGVGHAFEPKNNTARWLFLAAHPKPSMELR